MDFAVRGPDGRHALIQVCATLDDPVLQTLSQELNRRLRAHLLGLLRDRILDLLVEILDRHEALVATILRTEDEWRGSQGYPLTRNIAREAVRL